MGYIGLYSAHQNNVHQVHHVHFPCVTGLYRKINVHPMCTQRAPDRATDALGALDALGPPRFLNSRPLAPRPLSSLLSQGVMAGKA